MCAAIDPVFPSWYDEWRQQNRERKEQGQWIVSPEERTVDVYRLEGETYITRARYTGTDTIPSSVVEGCALSVDEVFDDTQPSE